MNLLKADSWLDLLTCLLAELKFQLAVLIPLKIKLINFYFEKGDINNVYEYLKSLIELVNSANNEDLPSINFYEQLSDPANFVDQNIPSAGMIDQLNQITALKIIEQKEEKQEGLRLVITSLKTEGEG